MSRTERLHARRAGSAAALFACLSVLGAASPSPANAEAEDLFILCVGAGSAVKPEGVMRRCFSDYINKIKGRNRRACRRGCRRLKRKLRSACRDLGNKRIVCRIGGRQINRACRRACRGQRCKALCTAERLERVAACGKRSRKARRCRRRARRHFRRCRRHCRR